MTLALLNGHGVRSSMLRRPSQASSLSSHSSSTYSSSSPSSSLSSYSSSSHSSFSRGKSSSPSSCSSKPLEEDDAEQVYVTSSSTIVLGSDCGDIGSTYDSAYSPNYYNLSTTSSSLHYDSANIRSIFFEGKDNEDQEISCFLEEDGSSDGEGDASAHYEVIYEAINELQQKAPPDDVRVFKADEDSREYSDDSFDSEDSDDAYCRLEPHSMDQLDTQDVSSELSYQRQGSVSSNGSQSINKIAEAANFGMWKLKKNWSQKKTEVKSGLNKMKKKGNSSDSTKSTENIYEASSVSTDGKRKWSFKNHFARRKSTSSLGLPQSPALSVYSPDKEKETSTFYLTLTIKTDKREAAAAAAAEASQRLKGMDLVRNIDLLDTVKGSKERKRVMGLGRISDVDVIERPKSCIENLQDPGKGGITKGGRSRSAPRKGSRPVRPKNAPPAPPSDQSESEEARTPDADLPKEKLFAMRLNQVLSAGPSSHRGRRVLKSSQSVSEEMVSPVPILMSPDNKQSLSSPPLSSKTFVPTPVLLSQQKSSTLKHFSPESSSSKSAAPLRLSSSSHHLSVEDSFQQLPEEITSCVTKFNNTPNTRSSVVSSNSCASSEGYIKPSDVTSIPPPLPARPSSQQQRLRKTSEEVNSNHNFSASALECSTSFSPLEVEGADAESHYMSSHFADEPLYQFYAASVLERATCRQGECSSEDDYEVINDGSGSLLSAATIPPRPSAMEIVTPTDGRRTLWCELSEVSSSGILNTLTSGQRKVQEAMFEVITSEASYLKSLDVLVHHFLQCQQFQTESIITKREKNTLFSDILPVKRCSEMFLADLEKRWQESVLISTIADVVLKHASTSFSVYVKYCSNQIYQDRMLKHLKESNPRFLEVLTELESSPKCQSLAMHSFLMLPMQRITRLPLLIDAIFHRLEHGSPHWHQCNLALATLNKVVTECNEGARKMERMEEMLIISRQLDFREVRAVPLISASRWLVKKGELTRLIWRELDSKLTFGKRISKHTLYFFLFTDLLVVTKRKSEDIYTVLDHCPRNMVQVLELDTATDKNHCGRLLEGQKNLLIVTMLQNHENRTVEMVLSCSRESERTRWVEAVTPRTSDNPDEQIYEEWDCPQVQATHAFSGSQPDELSLEVSDVVNVLKKMSDGWYQGERLRDGERGWFPASYCREIASSHIRARNLRQRYRFLTLSSSMVEELKRNALEEERNESAKESGNADSKKERRKTVTIQDMIGYQAIK